jgi:hypothetical protein
VLAILERLFISLADKYGDNWMREDKTLFQKMQDEVKEARRIKNITGHLLRDLVLKMFERVPEMESHEPTFRNGTFSYGGFCLELPEYICSRIMSIGDLSTVLHMLIRLRTVGFQGQQWAMPRSWFRHIRETFGLDLIAFSSPVNVQMEDVKFCSVNTADIAFGSVGNFFSFDLEMYMAPFQNKTMVVTINAPFVEDVLARAVHRVDEMFQLATSLDIKLVVFFNGPNWDDAKFFQLLSQHRFLRRSYTLKKGRYFYEDCFEVDAQSHITGRFESQLFALSNNPELSFATMTKGFEHIEVRKPSYKSGGRGAIRRRRTDTKKCQKCQESFTPRQPQHRYCKKCAFK